MKRWCWTVCIPGGSDRKESACNVGGLGFIPGSGGAPGEGNSCPLQYSCLENPMDRGAWWAIVHGVAELNMTEQQTLTHTLSHTHTHTHTHTHRVNCIWICICCEPALLSLCRQTHRPGGGPVSSVWEKWHPRSRGHLQGPGLGF